MLVHVVSNNTKLYIPALFQDRYTVKEICRLLGVKKMLVYKTLDFFNIFGIVYNPHIYSTIIRCCHILSTTDILFIWNVFNTAIPSILMSSNTSCGRSAMCTLQSLPFLVLCSPTSLHVSQSLSLPLSGVRSCMHTTWIVLGWKRQMQTCYCLLMKLQRTDTHLCTWVGGHPKDSAAMTGNFSYAVCTTQSSLSSHLMVWLHTISFRAQLIMHIFYDCYGKMWYVQSIFISMEMTDFYY